MNSGNMNSVNRNSGKKSREKLLTAAPAWALAALFGALALPTGGWAQDQDFAAEQAPSWNSGDAMPGAVRTQSRPKGSLGDENNNGNNGQDNRETNTSGNNNDN